MGKRTKLKPQSRKGLSTRSDKTWDFTQVATDFVEQSTQDANIWPALLSTPTVAHYARKAVMAKVKRDPIFAKHIALTAIMGASAPSLSPGRVVAVSAVPPAPEPVAAASPRTPSVLEESAPETPVRKVRRRLRFKQGYDPKQELMAESSLGSLSLDLAASIFSFVDVRSKIGVFVASMGLREVMQQRVAWEPLIIEKSVGRGLLHRLKQKDPLGYFTEERLRARRSFPRGFFEVATLEIDLMDPERIEAVQSDTEDDAPRPLMMLIPDPLDEIIKRLKHYFTRVADLTIRNIEDYRMDYRFVELRCNDLCNFPFVLLCHGSAAPQTYCLRAKRHAEPAGLCLNAAAAKAMNAARIPSSVELKETHINERETLFLQEHLSAFKNGNDFCLAHSIYRYVPSHAVRKKYKAVLDVLRQRFPHRFAAAAESFRSPVARERVAEGSAVL